jgi:hypothetical protein
LAACRKFFRTDNNEDYVTNNINPKFSHFVAVPLTVLHHYEENICIDESTCLWEISKKTTDQLRKLLAKLGRSGQSNKLKKDLLNSLYMITSEEQASSKLKKLNDELNHFVSPQSKVVFRVISALFGENDNSTLEHSEMLPCKNYFYKTQYDDIINYNAISKDQFP